MIKQFSFSVKDVFPHMPKNTVAVKFKDPETGKTWADRGKLPTWLQGKNKDDFLVK